MTAQIRKLQSDDAAALLDLLRRALTEEPLAFVTSLDDESVSSIEVVRKDLERSPDNVVFGAFDGPLVGMLWFTRESRRKKSHKALIWRTFVLANSRGQGIGAQLIEAAIEHARTLDGVAALWLGVSEISSGARKLYERFGFRVWGTEPDSIRFNGESALLNYMMLELE